MTSASSYHGSVNRYDDILQDTMATSTLLSARAAPGSVCSVEKDRWRKLREKERGREAGTLIECDQVLEEQKGGACSLSWQSQPEANAHFISLNCREVHNMRMVREAVEFSKVWKLSRAECLVVVH